VARAGGIAGANARLAALGVHAKAVQVKAGCSPARVNWVPRPMKASVVAAPKLQKLIFKTRFDPKQIPAGRTLVIPAVRAGVVARVAPLHLIRGAAPNCFPVVPPPLGAAIASVKGGGAGGPVHCTITRPGLVAADAKGRKLTAPVVVRDGHVALAKLPAHVQVIRLPAPQARVSKLPAHVGEVKLHGKLPPPVVLAARFARACQAAATNSRASRK
jgi:hypothetical protein